MNLDFIFLFTGTMVLLQLAIQDLHTRKVDERPSNIMFGVLTVISLLTEMVLPYIGALMLFFVISPKIKEYVKDKLGGGDITVLSWVFPGLIILNFYWFAIFCLITSGYSLIPLFLKKQNTPFVTIIFFSFLTIFALYFLHLI